jgi:hypothetical protein
LSQSERLLDQGDEFAAVAVVSKALGERIVVDLELCYLLVLVGSHRNERGLVEDERAELA